MSNRAKAAQSHRTLTCEPRAAIFLFSDSACSSGRRVVTAARLVPHNCNLGAKAEGRCKTHPHCGMGLVVVLPPTILAWSCRGEGHVYKYPSLTFDKSRDLRSLSLSSSPPHKNLRCRPPPPPPPRQPTWPMSTSSPPLPPSNDLTRVK